MKVATLPKVADKLSRYRRQLFEFIGSARYSKPAFDNIDDKLEHYLPNKGVFIEVGAHDGFTNSNTYYLEKLRGWQGILIEPIPTIHKICTKTRPKSQVFNCALVSFEYPDNFVKLYYANTCTFIADSKQANTELEQRLQKVRRYTNPFEFEVPARTLTSILDELKVSKIDFFSLDVEGYEIEVLKGLDLSKYQPGYLLVECQTEEAKIDLETYIGDYYCYVNQLSHRDYLYKAKSIN